LEPQAGAFTMEFIDDVIGLTSFHEEEEDADGISEGVWVRLVSKD
jgi:hypothetical protein